MEVDVDVRRRRALPRAARAAMPIVCVAGSSSRRRPLGSSSQAGAASGEPRRVRGQVRRAEGRARAVDVPELRERLGDALVDVPAAAAEEPRLEPVLAQPRGLVLAPARRAPATVVRAARARGPTKCVCCPSGPCAAASARARATAPRPHRPSRPAVASARRSRNPPGRAPGTRRSAAQQASSSGRSTWHETTAYRLSAMCGICGLLAPAGPADPRRRRAR